MARNLFSLHTTRHISGTKESRYVFLPPVAELPDHLVKYQHAIDLAEKVGDLQEGQRFFAIIDGKFIFGDLIEALIKINNYDVKELTISTLSMSQDNIDSLYNLLNGDYVRKLNLIISDFFYSHERHGLMPYLYQELDTDNKFQLAVAGTHTKIVLIETACGKKIVMHGSANLRSSSNIEQIMIECSTVLFDFNYDFHKRILEAYKTINHSVRRTELWQAVQQEQEKPVKSKQTPKQKLPPDDDRSVKQMPISSVTLTPQCQGSRVRVSPTDTSF